MIDDTNTATDVANDAAAAANTATDDDLTDTEIQVRQDAEEEQLRIEAEELRVAEAAAAAGTGDAAVTDAAKKPRAKKAKDPAPVPPAILFGDLGETGIGGEALVAALASGTSYLIFGDAEGSINAAPVITVQATDWSRDGSRSLFAGEFTFTGSDALDAGIPASQVAVASSPDGPVLALCELPGGALLAAGREFKFGPGSLVFG